MTEEIEIDNDEDTSKNFKVPLTKILEVKPHPNADRLSIYRVYGFEVISGKDKLKVGEEVFYIPINSCLSQKLEDHLFPPDSKIKLTKHRIKLINIRNYPTEGMIVRPSEIESVIELPKNLKLEHDYQELLGITKYTPQLPNGRIAAPNDKSVQKQNSKQPKKVSNPLFTSYNGCLNIKWYPDLFKETDEVWISEKLHGSSWRASCLPKQKLTFWDKVKKFFGKAPYEFLYGSNNVNLSNQKGDYKGGYYSTNHYHKMVMKYEIDKKLKPGEFVFAELIGDGIQKNYNYGLTNEHKIVVFDLRFYNDDGSYRWASHEELTAFCARTGLEMVPTLYKGKWNKEIAQSLVSGPSVYCPEQKVREGIVIKHNDKFDINRAKIKMINPAYLVKEQNDETSSHN